MLAVNSESPLARDLARSDTSRQYAIRKLSKGAPEIHARDLVGELSAHARMVEAVFCEKLQETK
jgi:hypothetical protein